MPGQCHDQPCSNGGLCSEGWNRHVCDCSQTSFSGATCGDGESNVKSLRDQKPTPCNNVTHSLTLAAAGTLKFEGTHSMSLNFDSGGVTHEADDVMVRFRTREQAGLLMATASDRSADRLEAALEGGRVRVEVRLGQSSRSVYAGQSLNDDIYHTLTLRRRGSKIEAIVDDDEPVMGEVHGSQTLLSYSRIYVGGTSSGSALLPPATSSVGGGSLIGGNGGSSFSSPSAAPGFIGSMQHLTLNGQELFRLVANRQLSSSSYALNAILVETPPEQTVS